MTDPITRLEEVRRDHNVVAAFPSLDAARAAIVSLERAGLPADSLSLLGAQPDDSAATAEAHEYDSANAAAEPTAAAKGAVAGGSAIGAAGALVGLAIPGIGPVVGLGLGALAGTAVGAVAGGVANIGDSEAWRHTFEAVDDGNFAVGVHSNNSDVVDRGESVLADQDPLALNRFPQS